MSDLFADQMAVSPAAEAPPANAPLADRLRPKSLDEVVGQEHLTGADGAIGRMVAAGRPPSGILWGAPGTGEKSLPGLLAPAAGVRSLSLSGGLFPVAGR